MIANFSKSKAWSAYCRGMRWARQNRRNKLEHSFIHWQKNRKLFRERLTNSSLNLISSWICMHIKQLFSPKWTRISEKCIWNLCRFLSVMSPSGETIFMRLSCYSNNWTSPTDLEIGLMKQHAWLGSNWLTACTLNRCSWMLVQKATQPQQKELPELFKRQRCKFCVRPTTLWL